MSSQRFELGVFNGKGDFAIWQQKMKGILVQQKVSKALIGFVKPSTSEEGKEIVISDITEEQKEMDELAYTSIILHLSDSVLRKVGKLDSTKELWERLESLYLTQSTPNKLFLLESFFSFKLDPSKDIDDNLDVFNKLVQDINNTGETLSDQYKAIILLNAIPDMYKDVKNAIMYGRDTLTPDIVVESLKIKEKEIKAERNDRRSGEVHYVRGRSQTRGSEGQNKNYKKKGKGRSKSQGKTKGKKCYGCGKT